jgi:YesN/AraC family two-component response regulator
MENYTEPLTLDTLARDLHLNKYYISHMFQKRMETGFSEFVNYLRIEHACEMLSKDRSVTEVAYASGFSSIRSFNRIFANKMGMPPTQYVKQKRM